MSIDVSKVLKAVDICKRTPAQVDVRQQFEEITEELNKDMKKTMEFLGERTDQELYQLSQVFERLSIGFESQEFVDFLKELAKKHPKAEMDTDIETAQRVIED